MLNKGKTAKRKADGLPLCCLWIKGFSGDGYVFRVEDSQKTMVYCKVNAQAETERKIRSGTIVA